MTATTIPQRTAEQRERALSRANEVRIARARLKEDVAAGHKFAVDVLASPPSCVETMKVYDLLVAIPRVGHSKAMKWLNRAAISPVKTVGGLTGRQRRSLSQIIQSERAQSLTGGPREDVEQARVGVHHQNDGAEAHPSPVDRPSREAQ